MFKLKKLFHSFSYPLIKYLVRNCFIPDAMLDALDTTLNKKNECLLACMGLAALWERKKLALSCVLERTTKHLPCENIGKAICRRGSYREHLRLWKEFGKFRD